jgi:hypothetical protein
MAHESSQNIQTIKLDLQPVTTQLRLLEIIFSLSKKERFCKFICPMKHPETTDKTEMKT